MNRLQIVLLFSLVSICALSWIMSKDQPDMMKAMMTYDPIAISLFVSSWTIGMAAMMFPSISPTILLYSRLIKNDCQKDNKNISNRNDKFQSSFVVERKNEHASKEKEVNYSKFSFAIPYSIRITLFVGCYLVVWALTGIILLLAWSIPMNTFAVVGIEGKQIDIIYGIILIISGVYQFTPLKITCIGYCESPLSFFMRRWKGGIFGAIKMGTYHGLYCLGCCWPYFLLMIALGWMNILWMGLFAGIIFAEKIWSKGIYVSKITGITFAFMGLILILGIISISDFNESNTISGNHMLDNKIIVSNSDFSNHSYTKNTAMDMDMK